MRRLAGWAGCVRIGECEPGGGGGGVVPTLQSGDCAFNNDTAALAKGAETVEQQQIYLELFQLNEC